MSAEAEISRSIRSWFEEMPTSKRKILARVHGKQTGLDRLAISAGMALVKDGGVRLLTRQQGKFLVYTVERI